MTLLVLGVLVFLSDLSVAYTSAKVFQAIAAKRFWPALRWNFALDLAIGINMIGFSHYSWLMLAPSCVGGALGLALAMKQDSD